MQVNIACAIDILCSSNSAA